MRPRTGPALFVYPLLAGLLLMWGAIGGAGRQATAEPANYRLVNPGYLTVATHGSLPPEIVVGPGDTLGGMDGVLYNAFVKDHGLKLKLFQTTFPSMILAVEQGKVDADEGVFYTAERAKHVYYTPGQIAARLKQHVAAGVTEICAIFYSPNAAGALKQMEQFARDVIPAVS